MVKTLKWQCPKCEDIVISSSKEHHKMDTCSCGSTAIDLEKYYTRTFGNPIIIKSIKPTHNGKEQTQEESQEKGQEKKGKNKE